MSSDVKSVLKQVRNLTQECLQQFQTGQMIDRAVVVIGKSGIGKTTLINILAGASLRSIYNDDTGELCLETQNEAAFEIGHSLRSQTLVPQRIDIGNVSYWDCPGWKDNRGPAYEIANAISIRKIFEVCRNVKIILAVSQNDIEAPRANELLELISDLDQLLPEQVEQLRKSIMLLIPKTSSSKTEQHVRNKINRVKQEMKLELSDSQIDLLDCISRSPMTLARCFPNKSSLVDTQPIKEEIFLKINQLTYAHDLQPYIGLSSDCKNHLFEAYNKLFGKINTKVNVFLTDFKEIIHSFARPYSNLAVKLDESVRKAALQELQAMIPKLKEALDIEYSAETITSVVEKCLEVTAICKKDLKTEGLTKALDMVGTMNALREFVDEKVQIPLQIVETIRNQILSSLTTLEKAEINIIAMNEKEKAEMERQKAEEAEKRAQEEKTKAEDAERRAKEAQERARRAQQSCSDGGGRRRRCTIQ